MEYYQSGSVQPPAATRVSTISIIDRGVQSYSVRSVLIKSSTSTLYIVRLVLIKSSNSTRYSRTG